MFFFRVCWCFQLLLLAYISENITVMFCHCRNAELDSKSSWWKQKLLVLFMITISFVALVQCFSGSDVLKWRSFYETHDNAWKQHYREVFDHGLRETLCFLGRYRYMYVPLRFDLPNKSLDIS